MFTYPASKKVEVVDNFHGTAVVDPYRWLEDPDSEETRAWVDAQVETTKGFLGRCDFRDKIRARIGEVYNYEKFGIPFNHGPWWFFYRNDGLQNQSVLYKMRSLDDLARAEVLIDLNAEFPEGTTAMSCTSGSHDGSLYAYGLSVGGSDWVTIRIRDVATGETLPDVVPWVKFSNITWTLDNKGFFYSRYPAVEGVGVGSDASKSAGTEVNKNENHMLYYHVVGTPAEADVCVFEDKSQPLWNVGCELSHNGNILLISRFNGCDPCNLVYYLRLDDNFSEFLKSPTSTKLHIVRIIDDFKAKYNYITNVGDKFYMLTSLGAPKMKVVSMTLPAHGSLVETDPAALAALPVDVEVAECDDTLEGVVCVARTKLVFAYLHDVVARLEYRDLTDLGVVFPIHLPAPGTAYLAESRPEINTLLFKYTSFVHAGTILRMDFSTETVDAYVYHDTVVPGLDPNDFEAFQDFAVSKDGTRVPVFYVRAKTPTGVEPPPKPCLLYGYGGFSVSLGPYFSSPRLVLLQELGAVFALAIIRGGAEYGEDWHKAGSLFNKQNCFDDFICAAEHLVAEGVTTSEQLCIQGGSNGGLLVLACALQRPKLYRGVISQVPVADMLRFHRFTIGHAWCTEYGNAEESKADFDNVMKYSPLHNVKEVLSEEDVLPAIMISTADHDDRVVPLHSYKMIATLQNIAGTSPLQRNPLLIRIDVKAGHGAGKPTYMVLDEAADIYAFIALCTGIAWPKL